MDQGFLKRCLEEGMSLRQIGERVGKDASTVGYWVKRHGLVANGRDKYSPRGGIDWEVLQIMSDDGLAIREMAEQLNLSESTICYWLREHGLSADSRRASRERRERARREG